MANKFCQSLRPSLHRGSTVSFSCQIMFLRNSIQCFLLKFDLIQYSQMLTCNYFPIFHSLLEITEKQQQEIEKEAKRSHVALEKAQKLTEKREKAYKAKLESLEKQVMFWITAVPPPLSGSTFHFEWVVFHPSIRAICTHPTVQGTKGDRNEVGWFPCTQP